MAGGRRYKYYTTKELRRLYDLENLISIRISRLKRPIQEERDMGSDYCVRIAAVQVIRWLVVMTIPLAFLKHAYADPDRKKSGEKSISVRGREAPCTADESLALPRWMSEKERKLYLATINAANRHRVDVALIKAIIMTESRFNPKAISECGAQGLMQLMPRTAKALGVEDSFDPEQNVDAGVRYFKMLKKLFDGDIKLALAAYNAGIMNVKRYQGVPPFSATQRYIREVFKYYHFYQQKPSPRKRRD
jgi:soluble lytic murein transglycosylase-like protein